MKHLRRFNENVDQSFKSEEYTRDNGKTLRDLIGDFKESVKKPGQKYNFHCITTKDVYVNRDLSNKYENLLDKIVELDSVESKDSIQIFGVYLKYPDSKYTREFGYLLVKDNKPHILSDIPGDNYGSTIFKGVFKVSGHDGSYMYDIDNPSDNEIDLK